MGEEHSQIEEIHRTRKITLDIRITAPVNGFITARNVSPKERFLKGAELYRIVNLDRVWILADVFEHEVQYFKSGGMAVVRLPQQKRTYHAVVSEVLPIFDPDTLTFKVRLETDNPGYLLRPDMFVDVEFPVSLPPAVTVPSDAVLHSGVRKTVFVDRGNGIFEPRQVKTGWRMGNRIEIVHGLQPGEKIVISGNFFIDSESRIQAAAQGIYSAVRIDPVCGMEVDEVRAQATGMTSVYQGKTYYFCMAACKQEFDKTPEQFLEKSPEAHEGMHKKNHPGAGHD
jgi:Cu(I)/Ag(I) efflux system membrane fusion protein